MKLVIAPRSPKSRKFPITLDLAGSPADVKVETVQAAIAKKFPQFYPDRQRLTVEKVGLETGKTLADYGIKDGDSVTFKDLGMLTAISIHPLSVSNTTCISYANANVHLCCSVRSPVELDNRVLGRVRRSLGHPPSHLLPPFLVLRKDF